MEIIIEENNYLEKFLRNNKRYSDRLIEEIRNNILNVINNKPYKIKTVGKFKYNGKIIYEYKVPLDKNFVCRVAYTKDENSVRVFYISTNIIKANFTKEVSHVKGVF